MADEDKDLVESALVRLVGVTEKSGNLHNDLMARLHGASFRATRSMRLEAD